MNARDAGYDRALEEAEREVVAADMALYAGLDGLKAHAAKAGSYSAPLGVVGALVAYRMFRRARRRRPVPSAMMAATAPAKAGIAALVLRLALPGVASIVRAKAMEWQAPGAASVPGAQAARALPRVSASLDRARFAGRWFEVGSLRDAAPGMSTLVLVPVPDGFDVECETPSVLARGPRRARRRSGVLRPTDPAGHPSELSLSWAPAWSRWLPLAWSDYWVLEVDSAYGFALIGDRARTMLAVLSRAPTLDESAWRQLMATAAEEGYPVERVHRAEIGPA